MYFKIKDGVDLSVLRNFGFELGSVINEKYPGAKIIGAPGYLDNWWVIIDEPVKTIDETPAIEVRGWVNTSYPNSIVLYRCVDPRNISVRDVELITDLVFQLTQAGLLERAEN